jgi:putative oxidoreductase
MYQHHAAREDTLVFPAWKQTLNAKQRDEIGEKFEEIEHQQFGDDGYTDAVKQIGDIEGSLVLADLAQFTAAPRQTCKVCCRGDSAMLLQRIVSTDVPPAAILIHLLVGAVFLSEGIQKFLFPDNLGVERFVKIGIPAPEVMAPFVGFWEIVCGALILLGLLARVATIPLIIDMLVAVATTKLPILLERGFWAMVHEARVDYAMLLGSIFLLIVGAGTWSADAHLTSRAARPNA